MATTSRIAIDEGIPPARGRSSIPADHTIVAHTSVFRRDEQEAAGDFTSYLPDDGRTEKLGWDPQEINRGSEDVK